MRKHVLSFVLVFALIMSMAVIAYADTSPYSYTVTPTHDFWNSVTITTPIIHYDGTPGDKIDYRFLGQTTFFDFDQFDSAYRVGLVDAYHMAGLKDSLTVPRREDTVPIAVNDATGYYWMELWTRDVDGTWNVKFENSIIRNGLFSFSPVTYGFRLMYEPI